MPETILGSVHITIGGTMADIMISPAAPIFWCWHTFLDHVYYDWQFCQVIVPLCKGVKLEMAKIRIINSGLKIGNVTRIPLFMIRPEMLSLLPQESIDPGLLQHQMSSDSNISHNGGTIHGAKVRLNVHSGLSDKFRRITRGPRVIGQSPPAGTTLSHGSSVDLTVLTDE